MKTAFNERKPIEGCSFSVVYDIKLLFGRSAHRADTGAGAAADALITIDDHVVTFGNAANRAFTYTCAASDTSIFINNVSHDYLHLGLIMFLLYPILYTKLWKKHKLVRRFPDCCSRIFKMIVTIHESVRIEGRFLPEPSLIEDPHLAKQIAPNAK